LKGLKKRTRDAGLTSLSQWLTYFEDNADVMLNRQNITSDLYDDLKRHNQDCPKYISQAVADSATPPIELNQEQKLGDTRSFLIGNEREILKTDECFMQELPHSLVPRLHRDQVCQVRLRCHSAAAKTKVNQGLHLQGQHQCTTSEVFPRNQNKLYFLPLLSFLLSTTPQPPQTHF
jgi:hypothetical protein